MENIIVEKKVRGRPRNVIDESLTVDSVEAKRIYNQRFYEKHHDKVLGEQKLKVVCECGIEVRKYRMKEHVYSKYHEQIMRNKKV